MNAENDKKKSATNDVIVPYVVNDHDNWHRKLAHWLADNNTYSIITEIDFDQALVKITNEGLHPDIIEQLLQEKLVTREEVYDIVIKQRTLSHRQINKQRLTSEETDRLLRLLRMKAIVAVFFGRLDRGNEWLNEPNDGFGGTKPISLIQSESGARLVEQTLERIAWGVIS